MAPVDSEPPYRAENPPGKAQRPLDTAAIAGTQQLTTTITESSDETNVGSQGAGLSISADPRRLPDTQALELGDVIGVGGMGEVSVCRDRALLREVAVKTVRADSNDVLAQECALMREAQIMAQLAHPHVLPVHQLGRSEGRAFLSMQLVTASTFEELVKEADSRGRLGTPGYLHEILDIAVRVCDTLSHAHEHGVVHCDIKPANIFVAEFGRVYVIDWGIARLREEWPRTRTFTGTPAFAASEQVETGIVDPRLAGQRLALHRHEG